MTIGMANDLYESFPVGAVAMSEGDNMCGIALENNGSPITIAFNVDVASSPIHPGHTLKKALAFVL